MNGPPDVVVAGLGVMGSAAVAELSRRGLRVLGLDPRVPPHRLGSSHGETRMIRQAYSEDPLYVPLVRRAFEAWRDVEARSGRRLLTRTGGVVTGPPEAELVRGAVASARVHDLPLEQPRPSEAARRFPWLRLARDHRLLVDPAAGHLRAEACVEAFLDLAREAGAEIRTGDAAVGWTGDGGSGNGSVQVRLRSGATVSAARLVIASGAWTSRLARVPDLPLRPVRMVQHWFAAEHPDFDPAALPVFLVEYEAGKILYGFPDVGSGVKAAFHHGGRAADPDAARLPATPAEVSAVLEVLADHFPGARWRPLRSEPCLYTLTPDRHFALGHHPASRSVVMAAGFSGHGFKFAPVVAELAADMLEGAEPSFDLTSFRPSRFGPSAGTDAAARP